MQGWELYASCAVLSQIGCGGLAWSQAYMYLTTVGLKSIGLLQT